MKARGIPSKSETPRVVKIAVAERFNQNLAVSQSLLYGRA